MSGSRNEELPYGTVLPLPTAPTASIAGPTLQESVHKRRVEPQHLSADAPNIFIVLLDDVGFGLPDTFGGEIHSPTLTRLAESGISYNTFHTTSICSPTRAALLTGRNHQRVGSGTIAERALDFDGYTGVIPPSAATIAEVLKNYGYKTSAFGKWHNTPATETTSMGPFDRWPTGYGFEYFYGFLAGETSQYEPRLYENTNAIEPPIDETYHLSEDLAEKAITWLRRHRAFSPDHPFLMYWAPGAGHGPHHVFKEWADKYAGKFDDGWDAYRERVFKRQCAMGWIPETTELTPRAESLPGWDSIPEAERPFQRRLMEVFAGFVEHVDVQVGKVIDELEQQGLRENTLIFYIWGDNGASAEGQNGSICELLAQNMIPSTIAQQLAALEQVGGLVALGTAKTDNMYHAGWAWAGDTPFHHTKLVASHFGGTRNPLVISWPSKIQPDRRTRGQFHHVNDIAATLYEVLGITPPKIVHGIAQDQLDGISMAYTFGAPNAPGRKRTQYFENNGSRGIYHEGWYACAFGPFVPWAVRQIDLSIWDANADVWELYDLSVDFSQSNDLAAQEPERLASMKALFLAEAKDNKVLPVGAGLWTRIHPEDRVKTAYSRWTFDATTIRMPEFAAPGLGRESNRVTVKAKFGPEASGVLYALGGGGGGLSLFIDNGILAYEYNGLMLDRNVARAAAKLAAGTHTVVVHTQLEGGPASPALIVVLVDGEEVARTRTRFTVPGAFSASEAFNVGVDLGSPVSRDYAQRRPFRFNGIIDTVTVELTAPG